MPIDQVPESERLRKELGDTAARSQFAQALLIEAEHLRAHLTTYEGPYVLDQTSMDQAKEHLDLFDKCVVRAFTSEKV